MMMCTCSAYFDAADFKHRISIFRGRTNVSFSKGIHTRNILLVPGVTSSKKSCMMARQHIEPRDG